MAGRNFTFLSVALFLRHTSSAEMIKPEDATVSLHANYEFSLKNAADDTCQYTLSFSWKHDDELFIPTGPEDCDPVPPPLEHYMKLGDDVAEATGFDHISIDWTACGHPPGPFMSPHYDVHMYRPSIEERAVLTCDSFPPVQFLCNFGPGPFADSLDAAQASESGKAYFNVSLTDDGEFINMPKNFAFDPEGPNNHAVKYSGNHAWDITKQPNSTEEWKQPSLIIGTYGGDIQFFEPMLPHSFTMGQAKYVESGITYVSQTIMELPNMFEIESNAGNVTITIYGMTTVECEVDGKDSGEIVDEDVEELNDSVVVGDSMEDSVVDEELDEISNQSIIMSVDNIFGIVLASVAVVLTVGA